MGLFKKKDESSNWEKLKDKFKLILEDMDFENITDVHFTYSGYAPLMLKLVEEVLSKKSWERIDENLSKYVSGP